MIQLLREAYRFNLQSPQTTVKFSDLAFPT